MKQLFTRLVLLASLVMASLAVAGDLTLARAVLEDPSGRLTQAEVQGRVFEPVGATLFRGYSRSAFWLRLRLRRPAAGGPVVLLIREPFLNEVRLFEPDPGTPAGWRSRVTGDHYPYAGRDRATASLGFTVQPGTAEATYYLRLRTSTPAQLTVEALEPAEAAARDHQFDLLAVFFVTAMGLLLVWAVHSYFLDRLRVVGLFALHQATYTLFGVAITGYLARWLPPGLADLASAVPYCAVTFTTVLFCRDLFRPYEPPALLRRGLDLFLLAFPLQAAAMALGWIPAASISNYLLVRVVWWYLVLVAFSLRREQVPRRRTLQAVFGAATLVFTGFWVLSSHAFGGPSHLIGRQILIASGLIIGGLFAMILNARTRRLLLEAEQSRLDLRARTEFLATVSHEVRTPLNALVGFSGLARAATDPAKVEQYLGILEQSARTLMELVDDILDMSKLEARAMALEAVPFDLRRLATALEAQHRPLAEAKGLDFQAGVAGAVPAWVCGDPTRLRQVLANLLGNAIKFTGRGSVGFHLGLAERTGEAGARWLRFEVRDTGIGMAEASRALLFQPFRQLDASISRRYGGTGLGLAIVHDLVALMGGDIAVHSREGEGSRFVVELPLPEAPAEPAALVPGSALVVEDNPFNRRLLEDLLTGFGQRVTLAGDGLQALELLEGQPFDLILVDIRMPGMDGLELARRIRRLEAGRERSATTILAVTADAGAGTRAAGLAAGLDAVLTKPVRPEALAQAIARHRPGTAAAPPGPVIPLDPRTRAELGADPRRALQFAALLAADIEAELKALRAALAAGDRPGLGRAAHTLKGLCGHLADPAAAGHASSLQRQAPAAGPEALRRLVEQLEAHFPPGPPHPPLEPTP